MIKCIPTYDSLIKSQFIPNQPKVDQSVVEVDKKRRALRGAQVGRKMINLMFDAHDCDGVVYNVHDSDYDCDLKMVQEVGYMWLMLFVLFHQG